MKKLNGSLLLAFMSFILPVASFAEEAAATGVSHTWIAFPVGFGIAIAAFAAALAQGRIASSFMEGVSRNPGAVNVMRTPFILALIFVETLVLFTILIELMLFGKI